MVRNMALEGNYDVIIADIRLPDMTGYELMLKLQEIMDPVPLVLMTGFGYDPGHSIVKARQARLPLYGVLYKPFRLDQLLDTVERIVQPNAEQSAADGTKDAARNDAGPRASPPTRRPSNLRRPRASRSGNAKLAVLALCHGLNVR